MLIDAYDLTGKTQYARYQDKGKAYTDLVQQSVLRDLLIIPSKGKNRRPYLQNPDLPCLEDFWDEDAQEYRFDKSYTLATILKELSGNADIGGKKTYADYLGKYFLALSAELQLDVAADMSVVTIPDSYDERTQEFILQSARLGKSMLLWRSVAACLGAESEFKKNGAQTGDKVLIVDHQRDHLDLSVFELECGEYVLPVRKAFRQAMTGERNVTCYPAPQCEVSQHGLSSKNPFELHTYRGTQNEPIVWNNGKWQQLQIFARKNELGGTHLDIPKTAFQDVRFVLCVGEMGSEPNLSSWGMYSRKINIIEPPRKNYVLDGASLFANRLANGLPTYYDTCDGLAIVAQNTIEEFVGAVPLIPPQERCAGGEVIIGEDYTEARIDPDKHELTFHLLAGDVSMRNVPLKSFNQKISETQGEVGLVLKSSMTPGQGLAKVWVYSELFDKPVVLDLLNNMKPTTDTISSLDNKLRRSFPVDMPAIIAREFLWENISETGLIQIC